MRIKAANRRIVVLAAAFALLLAAALGEIGPGGRVVGDGRVVGRLAVADEVEVGEHAGPFAYVQYLRRVAQPETAVNAV